MSNKSFPYQKRVRAMGTALAFVSSVGLLFWLAMALAHLLVPSWTLGFGVHDLAYFERLAGEAAPDPKVASDKELRGHFEAHYAVAQPDLPGGVTKEIYASIMVYFTKLRAGEVLAGGFMPDEELLDVESEEALLDPDLDWEFAYLSGGMSPETTVREVILKDRAFFEVHQGTYRLLIIGLASFFMIVSLVILRMALAWRQGDPFGPGTTRGLRWLGVLFLVQFIAAWLIRLVIPDSGIVFDLAIYSSMFEDLAANFFAPGANLSCGIVFLTLSWVLDYGRKMQEEQALTI